MKPGPQLFVPTPHSSKRTSSNKKCCDMFQMHQNEYDAKISSIIQRYSQPNVDKRVVDLFTEQVLSSDEEDVIEKPSQPWDSPLLLTMKSGNFNPQPPAASKSAGRSRQSKTAVQRLNPVLSYKGRSRKAIRQNRLLRLVPLARCISKRRAAIPGCEGVLEQSPIACGAGEKSTGPSVGYTVPLSSQIAQTMLSPTNIVKTVTSPVCVGQIVSSPVHIGHPVSSPIPYAKTVSSPVHIDEPVSSPVLIGEAMSSPKYNPNFGAVIDSSGSRIYKDFVRASPIWHSTPSTPQRMQNDVHLDGANGAHSPVLPSIEPSLPEGKKPSKKKSSLDNSINVRENESSDDVSSEEFILLSDIEDLPDTQRCPPKPRTMTRRILTAPRKSLIGNPFDYRPPAPQRKFPPEMFEVFIVDDPKLWKKASIRKVSIHKTLDECAAETLTGPAIKSEKGLPSGSFESLASQSCPLTQSSGSSTFSDCCVLLHYDSETSAKVNKLERSHSIFS